MELIRKASIPNTPLIMRDLEITILIIQKTSETMTSKERVRKTFEFEKTDRVPIGFETNSEIYRKFCDALGVNINDIESFYQLLGVDYRSIAAPYTGPQLHQIPKDRTVNQMEGCIMKWVKHETGGYWDCCDFPLENADDETFDNFPIPDPDHFDYDAALDHAKSYGNQYSLHIGGPGIPDIINSNGRIMGMEDVLCNLAIENDAAIRFFRRRADSQLKSFERLLDKCRGYIDFMWLGEDLGTQIAPMISLELYRSILKPIHKSFVDLAKSYGLYTMIHTCGSSSWAYEDFIEIGINGVDTLQPEAVNMSPAYLTEHFAKRLNFRGCISTAGPLAYGTPEEVTENCRETLEIMKAARGYHFAPTHQIQDNTPVENVIAMYKSVHTFGAY